MYIKPLRRTIARITENLNAKEKLGNNFTVRTLLHNLLKTVFDSDQMGFHIKNSE